MEIAGLPAAIAACVLNDGLPAHESAANVEHRDRSPGGLEDQRIGRQRGRCRSGVALSLGSTMAALGFLVLGLAPRSDEFGGQREVHVFADDR